MIKFICNKCKTELNQSNSVVTGQGDAAKTKCNKCGTVDYSLNCMRLS